MLFTTAELPSGTIQALGYVNEILVFTVDGRANKWADNLSLLVPVDTGDTVKLTGGSLYWMPCKGVI